MTGKLTLSFAAATFVAALVGLWKLRDMSAELRAQQAPSSQPPAEAPAEPTTIRDARSRLQALRAEASALKASILEMGGDPAPSAANDPLKGDDAMSKLRWMVEKLEEVDGSTYEYYTDTVQELYELKRAVTHIKIGLKRVREMMAAGGSANALPTSLPPKGGPLGREDIERLTKQAADKGVRVEPGKVTVRGFLNMAPNTRMPIEYFVTRYPEAGHETLVHLVGPKDLEELRTAPYEGVRGLATALYKGMVAAGFKEGQSMRPSPESTPQEPKWLLPDGDVVYIYVRFELEGQEHLISASDWILDPKTGEALPDDCFRFIGSVRSEDPDTGDTVLACELAGLLVSVWPNRSALFEVGLPSAIRNDFEYNADRIPKPKTDGPLYLDVIFSKEALETTTAE